VRFCRSQGGNLLDLKGKRAFIAFNERRPAMHILKSRPWNLPESSVTPESLVFGRRKALALGAGMLAAGPALAQQASLPPAMRNTRYVPGRAITAEREVTTYNNFYEFGSHKTISAAAQRMPQRPWTVKVEGMVESPREYSIEDLLRRITLDRFSILCPDGRGKAAIFCALCGVPDCSAAFCHAWPAAKLVPLALYGRLHHCRSCQ